MAGFAGPFRKLVLCLSPIPALDAERSVGLFTGSPERHGRCSSQFANDRQHNYSGTSLCCRGKRGTQKEGLGRSKGGFTTKIHLRTNAAGLPIAAEIGGGQESDYKGYLPVMEAGGPPPKVLLADRGYDADAIRADMESRDGVAIIPTRKSRKVQITVDDHIYALRNMVERCINKMKNARRLATRYDKTASSYLGFVHLVSIRLWIKHFVNRT